MKWIMIVPGKIRPKELKPARDEYLSRLKRRLNLQRVEVRAEKIDSRGVDVIREAEGRSILKRIQPDDFVIALDERGERLTTTRLAQRIRNLQSATRRVVFVLGGALGLSEDVRARADALWRLSDLVLAGGVAEVVLLEALYRADSVNRNEPYHRA